MQLLVLHDLNGAELYVNPYDVSAVMRNMSTPGGLPAPGSVILLQGEAVQVSEAPGAVLYLLKAVPTLRMDFG